MYKCIYMHMIPRRPPSAIPPGAKLLADGGGGSLKRMTRKWRRKSLKSHKTDSRRAASSPLRREPQRLQRQRRGQPLHDHRERDDRERRDENVVAPRQIGGQGECERQRQSAA